jgi:hypothetical protein
MGDRRVRRTAFAAMLAAHAVVFVLLSRALAPQLVTAEPRVAVTPVYLVPARRHPRETRRSEAPPRTQAVRPRLVVELPPIPAAPPAVEAVAAPPQDGQAERLKLARALRASRAGCATPDLLTERERVRCEDRLAAGATSAKYIPTPLPPERRAYYDAVASAKQPYHAHPMIPGQTPVPTPRAGNSLAALQASNEKIRIPVIGCHIRLGPGGGVEHPAHTLKLGPLPCVIAPPQGPLTVEVGITNPDTVVKKKD